MPNLTSLIVLSTAALVAIQAPAAGAEPTSATPQDAATDLFAAWNTKDPRAFGAVFAPDAEFTDVVGNHARGRDAIAELHVFPFEKLFADATLTLIDVRDRDLTAGLSSLDAAWVVTGRTSPTGEPLPERTGVMHIVAAERDQAWVPLIVHNVDLSAARAANPGPTGPAAPADRPPSR